MADRDKILDTLQGLEQTLARRIGDDLEGRWRDHRAEMETCLAAFEARLKDLEVTSELGVVALSRVEECLRADPAGSDLARLRFDVNHLQARFGDLEGQVRAVHALLELE